MNHRSYRILMVTACALISAVPMLLPAKAFAAKEIWTLEQLQHIGDNATTLIDNYTQHDALDGKKHSSSMKNHGLSQTCFDLPKPVFNVIS